MSYIFELIFMVEFYLYFKPKNWSDLFTFRLRLTFF
jgi:hypothetical protein